MQIKTKACEPPSAPSMNRVGFTPDLARLLHAAVFFGGPPPRSIGDALRPGRALPQERIQTRCPRAPGSGVAMRSVRERPAAVGRLLPQRHLVLGPGQGMDSQAIDEVPRLPAGWRSGPAAVAVEA